MRERVHGGGLHRQKRGTGLRLVLGVVLGVLMIVSSLHAQGMSGSTNGARGATVAMATGVSGAVTRATGSAEAALNVGDELAAGTVVRVVSGSASLVYLTGEFIAIEAGEALTLGETAGACRIAAGGTTRGVTGDDALTVADNGMTAQNTERRWQEKMGSMYGIRGDAATVAVSPRLVTTAAHPVFVFYDPDSMHAGDRTYTLIVRDPSGRAVVEKKVTAPCRTFVEVPANDAALTDAAPGMRFTWSVVPTDATAATGDAFFLIADAATRAHAAVTESRIESLVKKGSVDPVSSHTLLAIAFLDDRERLFADAIPHLLALMRIPSAGAFAQKQMALTLGRFGNQTATIIPQMMESANR